MFLALLAPNSGVARGESDQDGSTLTVIRNAHLVPMNGGGVVEETAVVVRDGVISALVPESELGDRSDLNGASVIDAGGGYLVPGFVDAHIHYRHPDELLNYLAYGVTTVVSLGQPLHVSREVLSIRDTISKGEMIGPQIYATAGIIPDDVNIDGAEEARAYVRKLAADGYDFIKVYNETSREVFDAVVAEAELQGLSVFGHIPRNLPPSYSLANGLDVIAHAEEFYFTVFEGPRDRVLADFLPDQLPDLEKAPQLAEIMVRNDVAVIPVLGGGFSHMVFWDDDDSVFADPELKYLHPRLTSLWRSMNVLQREPLDKRMVRERIKYDFTHEITRRLSAAGVLVVTGSDAAVPNQPPGKSLHRELRELVKTGFSYQQALAATTRDAGIFIQKYVDESARIGRIEEGYEADLVLLSDNPLDTIRNAANIAGVMADGRWHPEQEISEIRERRAERYAAMRDMANVLKTAVVDNAPEISMTALLDSYSLNDDDTKEYAAKMVEGLAFEAFSSGNVDEVVRITTLNTELFPEDPNVWDTLGEVYFFLEQPEKARQFYQNALELDPGFDNARQKIEVIDANRNSETRD